MQLTSQDLDSLSKIAIAAAREAGALIADYSQRDFEVMHKDGCGSIATQVVTEVDELSQSIVLKHLEPTLTVYDLALLTEERPDDGSRFAHDYFWCIDPLDGTLPFTQREPGYAVSIALIERSGRPVIGVIYDPVGKQLHDAILDQGVRCDGERVEVPASEFVEDRTKLRFYCDCSFPLHPDRARIEAGMHATAEKLGYRSADIQMGGGAVMNAYQVSQNAPSAYFKEPRMTESGGSIWDFAATACIFSALGLNITNFTGGRLDLNRQDSTYMNHEGVCYATDSSIQKALAEVFSRGV
ncbi:MAG: 3'(2'),5'-bisphosphate nucleotidase CysQ family protein [Opitutaceae bacterium]